MFRIKNKDIIKKGHKILNNIWKNNNSDITEIYRQFINHFITYIALNNSYTITPMNSYLNDRSIILDIGCGAMTWSSSMINNYKYDINIVAIDINENIPYINYSIIEDEHIIEILKNRYSGNLLFIPYDVTKYGIKFIDNSIDFIYQRDMLSAYKNFEWDFIINEMYRVLKKGKYIELVEYDLKIYHKNKNETKISDIFSETLLDIFKEINIIEIYEKVKKTFGNNNIYIEKIKLPLYKENKFNGLIINNMIIGYTMYFKEILTNVIIKQTHSFESAIDIIKKEWETNESYMELNVIYCKK